MRCAPLVERLAKTVRRTFSGQSLWRPESALDRLYSQMVHQHLSIRESLAAGLETAAKAAAEQHAMDLWKLLELVLDESARQRESDSHKQRDGV